MTTNTKEFHEMRSQFEKDILSMPIYIGGKIERAERNEMTPNNVWYDNGVINQLFIAYMYGYQNGRSNYM